MASQDLINKLRPSRFSEMSPKMAAIVGCILGKDFTVPHLAEIVVTSDQIVIGRRSDDIGHNEFIGNYEDFEQNWDNLLIAANLTADEQKEATALYKSTVRFI